MTITKDINDIVELSKAGGLPVNRPVAARAVMLMAPPQFYIAEESASDNAYMDVGAGVDEDLAHRQIRGLAEQLSADGIPVMTLPGVPDAPDAVFPNNVWATVPGRLIMGAMRHAVRQRETGRRDLQALFQRLLGYEVTDLSERPGCVTELTGSLVIDRGRGLGFHGLTERLNESGVQATHEAFNLRASLMFELQAGEYHTNVVMSALASRGCVVCADGVRGQDLVEGLHSLYGGNVLEISQSQKEAFVANCIALSSEIAYFSATAIDAMSDKDKARLESWGLTLRGVDVSEVEKAGGSLRCMTAEIY